MNEEYWYPVDLELLNTGLEIYDIAVKNKVYLKDFDVNKLIDAIFYRANIQLDGVFYPEISMYFDDIQHNINGYYKMYNNYKLIKKYSK